MQNTVIEEYSTKTLSQRKAVKSNCEKYGLQDHGGLTENSWKMLLWTKLQNTHMQQ